MMNPSSIGQISCGCCCFYCYYKDETGDHSWPRRIREEARRKIVSPLHLLNELGRICSRRFMALWKCFNGLSGMQLWPILVLCFLNTRTFVLVGKTSFPSQSGSFVHSEYLRILVRDINFVRRTQRQRRPCLEIMRVCMFRKTLTGNISISLRSYIQQHRMESSVLRLWPHLSSTNQFVCWRERERERGRGEEEQDSIMMIIDDDDDDTNNNKNDNINTHAYFDRSATTESADKTALASTSSAYWTMHLSASSLQNITSHPALWNAWGSSLTASAVRGQLPTALANSVVFQSAPLRLQHTLFTCNEALLWILSRSRRNHIQCIL